MCLRATLPCTSHPDPCTYLELKPTHLHAVLHVAVLSVEAARGITVVIAAQALLQGSG